MEQARHTAQEGGSASAMVATTMGKAKLLGLDKPQPENVTDSPPVIIELVAPQTEEHWETH
ncbi:hypothetical protein [Eikenella halliae]|uniref:hypothetical protein n=1 Tax=Eikenella halliae TaxID=1795832 RepID=UPI0036198061